MSNTSQEKKIHRGKIDDIDIKDKLWKKAIEIKDKDPKLIKKDLYGNEIHYNDFGKKTKYGWKIDRITPTEKGGSDDIANLQILHYKKEEQVGGSMRKKSRHSECNKK